MIVTCTRYRKFPQYLLTSLLFVIIASGCAKKGLLTEKYPPDFYRISKLLSDRPFKHNPRFILYGDSRPGWRVQEKFLNKNNWATWKMAIAPFYHIYWLGNGAVGGINRLREAPGYGTKERLMVRDAIYREARRSNVDFIFHGGDIPTNGQRPSHWAQFIQENKIDLPLMLEFPMLPVIGNHERANDPEYGFPNYKAIFNYPRFYVLDSPDAAIFVLDSNVLIDQYGFIDDDKQDIWFRKWFVSDAGEKPAWLERELEARSQRFKIVVMHHPPLSFAKHHKDWVNPKWGRDLQYKRQQLFRLFREQGVQLVFSGHEHLYEHSVVRYPSDSEHTEHVIHVVVSGGGGVPLRRGSDDRKVHQFITDYRAEGLDVVLLKQEEIYHYCLVDIAADKVTIQVLALTGDTKEPLRFAENIEIPG